MGRISLMLAGGLLGSVQVLNCVYESEIAKQNIRNELVTLRRMKDFVSPSLTHPSQCLENGLSDIVQRSRDDCQRP